MTGEKKEEGATEEHTKKPGTFWRDQSPYHLLYFFGGRFLGIVCVNGGLMLFLRGIMGSTSWIADLIGLKSEFSDAGPGAILFIVGLFLMWITRRETRVVR